jgi:O-antigen ligase
VAGSHQGALEVITELGLVGLVLVIALMVLVGARVADRVMAGSLTTSHLACAGLLLAVVVSSVTEATLLAPGLPITGLVSGMLLNEGIQSRVEHPTASSRMAGAT